MRVSSFSPPGFWNSDATYIGVIALAVISYLALAVWMVTPAPPAGFDWDDAWYLFMAEWISGNPETRGLAWSMLQLRQYPPLWPLLIQLSGSGLADQSAAFFLNACLLVIGTCISMVWFQKEGFSVVAMLFGSALVFLNPITLYWLPTLFSEHLFICLSTLALYATANAKDKLGSWLFVGVVVGLSIATRSAGWALVLGILIYLTSHFRFAQLPAFLFGIASGILPFSYFKVGLPESPSYLSEVLDTVKGIDWVYFYHQVEAVLAGWQSLWGSDTGALLAGLLVLPGIALRIHKRKADAFYIIAYLGMIMLWPFPGHMARFLWPLLPAFVLAAHTSVEQLIRPVRLRWLPGLVLLLIFVTTVHSGVGTTLSRLMEPLPEHLAQLSRIPEWTSSRTPEFGQEVLETRLQFMTDMRRIRNLVPGDSCIYSELPALVATQAMRVSISSPWEALQDMEQHPLICLYYYLIPSAMPDADLQFLENFGEQNKELFRSPAPFNQTEALPLGIFYELKRQTTSGQ